MRERQVGIAWLLIALLAGVALTVASGWLVGRQAPESILIASPMPTPTAGPIRVYVSGAVTKPAVYTLPAGSIADDLVRAAGGLLADADPALVNLAQPLLDGGHVHVPRIGEGQLPADSRGPSRTGPSSGLININVADQNTLEQLPGIGPKIAARILDYRENNGSFQAIEEIENVAGIGPVTFENIRDLITIGQ